jgi:hypothetical protein
MTGLAELRSTVARLEWTYAALRSTEGNPHHDADGKFTSAGGEGSHHGAGKHRAGHQKRKARRKKKLGELHKQYKKAHIDLKKEHKVERRDLVKGEKKDRKELKAEHRRDRKEHRVWEKSEHREMLKGHVQEHRELVKEHKAEARGEDRRHAKHSEKMTAAHAGDKAKHESEQAAKATRLSQAREKHAANPAKLEKIEGLEGRLGKQTAAKGKRLERKHEAQRKAATEEHETNVAEMTERHESEHANLKEGHKWDVGAKHEEFKEARKQLKADHREALKDQRESHLEERGDLLEQHREQRQELVENLRYDLENEGLRRKGGGKPTEQPAKRRERAIDATGYMDSVAGGRYVHSIHRGDAGVQDMGSRRFHPGRTHKASSAEAILKHCLRQRGWTAAWRRGELTGREQLDLLGDIREYSRAWLRHEAEALFLHHGDPDYARGAPLGFLDRGIAASVASHVTRWFRRAKSFVHEAIVAGAMALSGPGELTSDDLREADDQAQRQAQYFDRFMLDAHTRPPAGLADDPEAIANAMTAAQFVARAEQYGDAPWAAAQHVERARMVRGRVYVEERRIHGRLLDDMCATCAEAVARGWVPIGTLPPIGDSECIGNCHCYFKYRDVNGSEAKTVRKSKGKRKPLLTRRPVVEAT